MKIIQEIDGRIATASNAEINENLDIIFGYEESPKKAKVRAYIMNELLKEQSL